MLSPAPRPARARGGARRAASAAALLLGLVAACLAAQTGAAAPQMQSNTMKPAAKVQGGGGAQPAAARPAAARPAAARPAAARPAAALRPGVSRPAAVAAPKHAAAAPRAALCFFGLPRALEMTKDSIRNNVFDVLTRAGWEYDVYLHTYRQASIVNPRSKENNVTLDMDAWKLLRPGRYLLDDPAPVTANITAELQDYLSHGDAWKERAPHHSLRNLLLQLHSIERVTGLWGEGAYDVAIYLRPDMWYFNPINMTHVSAARAMRNTVFVPSFGWAKDAVNDRMAFGHPAAMKVWGNRKQQAKAYSRQHNLHSERFVKYALQSRGIRVAKTDLLAERVRANGVLWGVPQRNKAGVLDFPSPGNPRSHFFMVKTALGSWDAVRCNATTKAGSRC